MWFKKIFKNKKKKLLFPIWEDLLYIITSKTKENRKNYLKWGWVINMSQGKLTLQTLDGMILNDLNENDIHVDMP